MRVLLGFPWRPTEDRRRAFEVTYDRLVNLYPFSAVVTVDSGHAPFNRPQSRNLIFDVAEEREMDVVVCCDADSVPTESALVAAIDGAEDGKMHFPFDEAWYVNEKGMLRVAANATAEQVKSRIYDKCSSEGGAWVCTPQTWLRAGGQDYRLANWGCDDRAFLAASRTLVGMPVKHQGVLYCLPHFRPEESEIWVPEEVGVLTEYESAYMNPEKMLAVIDSRPPTVHPNPTITVLKEV
jgi:hypothetical protein